MTARTHLISGCCIFCIVSLLLWGVVTYRVGSTEAAKDGAALQYLTQRQLV